MTKSYVNTLTRKAVLGLSAIVISTMSLVGAADAKPKFNFEIQIGSGGWAAPGIVVGSGWANPCWWYKKKYDKTGKLKWKTKYDECMWYYY